MKKDQDAFVEMNARDALNFNISSSTASSPSY
jgi:uncharacterized Tic20 family protein